MSIGFKEWTLICEALGGGQQSIILRKGGIAEGRAGFRFQHEEFLLLPTLFHEQVAKLKLPADTPLPQHAPGVHTVSYRIHVEWTRDLSNWEQIRRLDPFHLWREHVIRERFEYEGKQGVSLAFVRVFKLNSPASFPDEPKYGGCRSWVNLPDLQGMDTFHPVITDEAHRAAEAGIVRVLES